jgi:hypothetical protein
MGENPTAYSLSLCGYCSDNIRKETKRKKKKKRFSLWKLTGKCVEKVSLLPLLSYFPCIFHSHMQRRPYSTQINVSFLGSS